MHARTRRRRWSTCARRPPATQRTVPLICVSFLTRGVCRVSSFSIYPIWRRMESSNATRRRVARRSSTRSIVHSSLVHPSTTTHQRESSIATCRRTLKAAISIPPPHPKLCIRDVYEATLEFESHFTQSRTSLSGPLTNKTVRENRLVLFFSALFLQKCLFATRGETRARDLGLFSPRRSPSRRVFPFASRFTCEKMKVRAAKLACRRCARPRAWRASP